MLYLIHRDLPYTPKELIDIKNISEILNVFDENSTKWLSMDDSVAIIANNDILKSLSELWPEAYYVEDTSKSSVVPTLEVLDLKCKKIPLNSLISLQIAEQLADKPERHSVNDSKKDHTGLKPSEEGNQLKPIVGDQHVDEQE